MRDILYTINLVTASIFLPLCCLSNPLEEQYGTSRVGHEDENLLSSLTSALMRSPKKRSKGTSIRDDNSDDYWYANLKIMSSDKKESSCGGIIIGDQQILTAAHCVSGDKISSIEVGLTLLKIKQPERWNNNVTVVKVNKVCTHEQYSSSSNQFDFAILLLERSVKSVDYRLTPVELPKKDACYADKDIMLVTNSMKRCGIEYDWPGSLVEKIRVHPLMCPAIESNIKMSSMDVPLQAYDGTAVLGKENGQPTVYGIIIAKDPYDKRFSRRNFFHIASTYFYAKEIKKLMGICKVTGRSDKSDSYYTDSVTLQKV